MRSIFSSALVALLCISSPALADLKIKRPEKTTIREAIDMPQKLRCISKNSYVCVANNCRRTVIKDTLEIDLEQTAKGLLVCDTNQCVPHATMIKTKEKEWQISALESGRQIRLPAGGISFSESYTNADSVIVRFGTCEDITPKEEPSTDAEKSPQME